MVGTARAGAILVGLVLAAALPAAASADSIVYLKDKDVWIAHPDGSGARQFTGGHTWASPSEADDGTVVAVGGLERVNADGTDSGGDSELYRFKADGTQLGNPIPTWGSYSTPACPTYGPYSAQVSPDGSKIAYGIHECGDNSETAMWTPSTATALDFPNGQKIGQEDYYEPSWVDSTHFVVSHAGPPVTDTQTRWFVHGVEEADQHGTGWYEPAMTAPAAQAVISRDGKRMAIFTNDASDYLDGKPRNVQIWFYTSPYASYPGPGQAWSLQCQATLDAAHIPDPLHLSPSFSPDGSKVLWADDQGVELALPPGGSDCSGFKSTLLIPGGAQPFYAKGNLAAAATVVVVAPGDKVTPSAAKPKAAFSVVGKHLSTRKKVTFDASRSAEKGGRIVSYRWSFGDHHTGRGRRVSHRFRKAKTYKVKLTVVDAKGQKASVTHTVRIKRR